MNLLTKDAKF